MSYFAKASRTGVEKVAVAIVLRRRQLSALQGGVREMPSRAAQPFASTRQVSACKGCKGEMSPRSPAQPVRGSRCTYDHSGPQQRSPACETQASGPSRNNLPTQMRLAFIDILAKKEKKGSFRGLYSKNE